MSTMVSRFQRGRWSNTRVIIDAMDVGDKKEFPVTEYFNCHATVDRLNDAYDDREWEMQGWAKSKTIAVRRIR